jgi:tight adherence protein B
MNAGLLLTLSGLLLLGLALLLLWQGYALARSERVVQRLRDMHGSKPRTRLPSGLKRLLLRAGIELSNGTLLALAVPAALFLLLIATLLGLGAALVTTLLLAGGLRLLLSLRYRQRVSRMVHLLPPFLDHAIRSLKSGRSLGDALLLAMQSAQQPLRDAFASTRRQLELGLPIDEVLGDFAELYGRREFHILAVSVKVNHRYGGNATELLASLITLIRDRERAAGQLRAMTGETRVGAWVLGLMPLLLGIYLFSTNPQYFLGLWDDAAGRMMLYGSLLLQGSGCYILYRMLRSI